MPGAARRSRTLSDGFPGSDFSRAGLHDGHELLQDVGAELPAREGQQLPNRLVVRGLSREHLRILRYLGKESLTPAELSRRLRLRIPTVMHHLQTLRMAGLVRLVIEDNARTNFYTARPEAVKAAFNTLQTLLKGPGEADGLSDDQAEE